MTSAGDKHSRPGWERSFRGRVKCGCIYQDSAGVGRLSFFMQSITTGVMCTLMSRYCGD